MAQHCKKQGKVKKMTLLEGQGCIILFGLMVLYTLIFCIFPVMAWSSTSFQNSTNSSFTSENLIFTGNQNITRYLKIPSNLSFFTQARFNITTTKNFTCYQESVNQSSPIDGICNLNYTGNHSLNDGIWQYNLYRVFDADWTTFDNGFLGGGTATTYINYTKPNNSSITNVKWKIADVYTSSFPYNGTNITIPIPDECFDYYTDRIGLRVQSTNSGSPVLAYSCYNGGWILLESHPQSQIWEEAVIWENNISSITNPKIYINDTQIWSYTGMPNGETNISSYKDDFNNYVLGSPCQNIGGFCYIPIIFHSDTAGTLGYKSIYFTNVGPLNEIFLPENFSDHVTNSLDMEVSFDYDNVQYEHTNVEFYSNFSTGNSTLIKDFTMENIGSGTTGIYIKTIDVPNRSTYYGFYYVTNLFNTYDNSVYSTFSDTFIVNLSDIKLDQCNATVPTKTLNFTAYDQDKLTRVNGFDFAATLSYYIGNGSTYKTISFNNASVIEKTLCIDHNYTYKISGIVEYFNESYQRGSYSVNRFPITNVSQNINLYLMNGSLSTSFIIKVQDTNQMPLPDYEVYIYRYYPATGSSLLVQSLKTDSAGQGVGFFETETVDYWFKITDQYNNLVLLTEKRKIIPETTPYTLTFTIGSGTPPPFNYFNNLTGITYTLSYNKGSKVVSYVYSDSNSSFNLSYLTVSRANYSDNNNIVCNNSNNVYNGVISCDMSSNSTGSYTASAYVIRNGVSYLVSSINFDISGMNSGLLGIFGGFMIILICAFAFVWNEVAGIIMVDLGIIAVQLLGLINFGIIGITAAIGISIIIIVILERG